MELRIDRVAVEAMINPKEVAFFVPNGLAGFKQKLFDRIGSRIQAAGGRVVRGDCAKLDALPNDIIPIVGCTYELKPLIERWRQTKRTFIYWDRGYYFRVFATWLPRGENGGNYRWHVNSFQLQELRDVPADRLERKRPPVQPWANGGKHIVIAAPPRTYARFHGCENWVANTIDALARVTDRQLVIRDKESKRPLQVDLDRAHALVTHGSIAAVESVVLGCPVFVHPDSAASLVGLTDLKMIEQPIYPDREPWLRALSYSQFSEPELVNGDLWKMLS